MTQNNHWNMRALALTLAAVVCIVVVTALDRVAEPVTAIGSEGASLVAAQPEPSPAQADPAAACRMAPECWTNADCDERCGAGLGKCIHSNCPVRICRCR